MTRILAIDPGPESSGYVLYEHTGSGAPGAVGDRPGVVHRAVAAERNGALLSALASPAVPLHADWLVLEDIRCYGMPVGADVFETVFWTGRFFQAWWSSQTSWPARVSRRTVKVELCGNTRAKDSHIRQALIDRWGPGKDKAIGLKATPGPLYTVKSHAWQALGLALTYAETCLSSKEAAASR